MDIISISKVGSLCQIMLTISWAQSSECLVCLTVCAGVKEGA